MILSVLAGQKSAQEVIEQEQVSRTFYYQPLLTARAELLVRQLNGLIGAAALTHAVIGLSRREAARIKCATPTLIASASGKRR